MNSNHHPLVELPPEPLTSPREARPGKPNDGPPLGSSTIKQCRATAEKENVNPTSGTPPQQPSGKARENTMVEERRTDTKSDPNDLSLNTLTRKPLTSSKPKNLYAGYTPQIMGSRALETQ